MNHQDIVDRRESLGTEQSRALQTENARIQRELASLQELCGGMGHIYVHLKGTWNTMMPNRICAACGQDEK